MTKETLEQYGDLLKEIENLENRIEKIENQSTMVSDIVQNGYKRHTKIFGVDLIRQHRLAGYKEKLQKFYDKLIRQREEIEGYIETIKEPSMRQIFRYRYIDGMNWIQIQFAMSYKHEDTARKKIEKYFKKLKDDPT